MPVEDKREKGQTLRLVDCFEGVDYNDDFVLKSWFETSRFRLICVIFFPQF